MDNVVDYLKWYGDLSFEEKPLSDVDNFILTKLVYLIVSDIELKAPMKFRDVVTEVMDGNGIRGCFYGREYIVELSAETRRFGEIYLSNYREVFDSQLSAQFAAMTFDLTEDIRFVAFRGTDDTLAGWKEDFMISYTDTVAQKSALEYLKESFDKKHQIYVGGHSKGANLALFAATHLPDELQPKLKYLYMNDGPGLCPEVCDKCCVDKVKDKAIRFMPEYSVFGKLFEEIAIPAKVVKSYAEGLAQHDMMTWGVRYGMPDEAEGNAVGSIFINQILDQWIESVDNEKRTAFVEDLFSAIENSGFSTTTQIMEKGPFAIEKILIELLSLDKETVKMLMKIPVTAALDRAPDEEKVKKISKKVKKREWLPYLGMMITSGILFVIPEYTMQVGISVALLALIVFEVVVTIRHLYKANWNLQQESARVYVCIVMIGIYAMLLVKEDALFLVGSMFIGIAFLAWAYRNAIVFRNLCAETEKNENVVKKIKLMIEIIMLVILSGFILVAPKDTLAWYMMFLGIVFFVDGVVNMTMVLYNSIARNRKL